MSNVTELDFTHTKAKLVMDNPRTVTTGACDKELISSSI